MARPSKYASIKPKMKFISPLIQQGFSDKDIAVMLGINQDTLYEYKKKYKEFSECFEKEDIAKQVEETYVNRLLGKYKAEKEIFMPNNDGEMILVRKERYEIPFNDGAYKHYLSTIMPEKWREKENNNSGDDIVNKFIEAVVKAGDNK